MDEDPNRQKISDLADKLQKDLMFAAPELWRMHILRRFAEVIDLFEDDDDD